MADKKTAPAKAPEGPAVPTYASTVLVVVPRKGFAEETLRHARACLYNVHVGTRTVSTVDHELIRGRLQDEFQVDGSLASESMSRYSGVVFVGGEGARELANDAAAQRLAREAAAEGKLVAAWGDAVAVLARAGVIKGLRVTGKRSLAGEVANAGAKFTGQQVERDGNVVTGLDDAAGLRFGRALARVVGI